MSLHKVRLVCERDQDPTTGDAIEREEETFSIEAATPYEAFRRATLRMTIRPRGRLLQGYDADTGALIRPPAPGPFRRSRFLIEDVQGPYEGYTNGETWNGWAVPYFEFEVARRVAADYVRAEEGGDMPGASARYDEWQDAFVLNDPCYEDEAAYGALKIEVNRTEVEVYPIGAREWTWEEGDEAE